MLFVDNGSCDDSVEFVRKRFRDRRLKILSLDQNYGWAGGNNRAFQHTAESSEYIAFLNNDVVVTPGWLTPIIEIMQLNDDVSVAGPVSLKPNGKIDSSGLFMDLSGEAHNLTCFDESADQVDVFYVSGSCLVVKKRIFEELNGFDEDYYCYYEETDFCSRVHGAGFRVVLVPRSRIYHYGGLTIKRVSEESVIDKKSYYYTRNRFHFILKNYPNRALFFSVLLAPLYTLALTGAYVLTIRNMKKALGVFVGLLAFLRSLRYVYQSRKRNTHKPDIHVLSDLGNRLRTSNQE